MIEAITELLNLDGYYGVSENIDVAKGKYKLPQTWKEGKENYKRWQLQK